MLQPEDFIPHLNTEFKVRLPAGIAPVPLVLRSLDRQAERTQPWLRQKPFVLIFHGPASRALPPATYELVWPDESRAHAIFVQIVMGSGPHGAIYEAIFN